MEHHKGKGNFKIELNFGKSAIVFAITALLIGYLIGNIYPLIKVGYTQNQQYKQNNQSVQNLSQQNQSGVKITIPSFAPYRGSDTAKLNLIEFGDYQCPFCERFFLLTETLINANYTNTGKIRFYFFDFQFLGPDSISLGEGAWCANEQGKYYAYHDYVYSHQGQENSGWAMPDKIKSFAANITGLDAQNFGSCLDSKKYLSRVENLTKIGQSVGVTGTPTIFVGNDRIGYNSIVGAYPYGSFQQLINSQLLKVS